jgi:hypothetical protein
MRRIILLALIVLMLGLLPRPGYAYCLVDDVPGAFKKAEAVFIGEVAEVLPPSARDMHAPYSAQLYTVRFVVKESFKGTPSPIITLVTDQGGRGCFDWKGGPFVKGVKYLVYADPFLADKGASLVVGHCSNRTASLSKAVADVLQLADIRRQGAMPLTFDYSFRPITAAGRGRKESFVDSWLRDN